MSDYEINAKVFKAFCDENRLKIIELLQTGEKCACTLEDALTISQSTLSHHMKILMESGVIKVRKDKKWSYYAICDNGAEHAMGLLQKLLETNYQNKNQCNCEVKKASEETENE